MRYQAGFVKLTFSGAKRSRVETKSFVTEYSNNFRRLWEKDDRWLKWRERERERVREKERERERERDRERERE